MTPTNNIDWATGSLIELMAFSKSWNLRCVHIFKQQLERIVADHRIDKSLNFQELTRNFCNSPELFITRYFIETTKSNQKCFIDFVMNLETSETLQHSPNFPKLRSCSTIEFQFSDKNEFFSYVENMLNVSVYGKLVNHQNSTEIIKFNSAIEIFFRNFEAELYLSVELCKDLSWGVLFKLIHFNQPKISEYCESFIIHKYAGSSYFTFLFQIIRYPNSDL